MIACLTLEVHYSSGSLDRDTSLQEQRPQFSQEQFLAVMRDQHAAADLTEWRTLGYTSLYQQYQVCAQLGEAFGQIMQQAAAGKMCAGRPLHECKEFVTMLGIAQPVTPAPGQPLNLTFTHVNVNEAVRELPQSDQGVAAIAASREQLSATGYALCTYPQDQQPCQHLHLPCCLQEQLFIVHKRCRLQQVRHQLLAQRKDNKLRNLEHTASGPQALTWRQPQPPASSHIHGRCPNLIQCGRNFV